MPEIVNLLDNGRLVWSKAKKMLNGRQVRE